MVLLAVRSSPTVRQAAAIVAALLALVTFAPAASAQVADPAVAVELAQPALELGAANTTTLAATVTNGNPNVGGTVVLAVTAPDGWTVVASPKQIPLAAGASEDVLLTITAPDAAAGAATGRVLVSATITEDAATARTAEASATLDVTRVDPVIPPPPPPAWYETTAGMVGIAGTALALVGAIVATVILRRRRRQALAAQAAAAAQAAYLDRETGVTVQLVEPPRTFGPKRELVFRVAVQNTSARPRVGVLDLELPDGWSGAPSRPRVPLSPGERTLLTVCVRAGDAVAADAQGVAVVRARPEEAQELWERVEVPLAAPTVRLTPAGTLDVQGQGLRATANQRALAKK